MTKDRSFDRDLEALIGTHSSALVQLPPLLSACSDLEQSEKNSSGIQKSLHHDIPGCTARSKDLPSELDG